MPANKKHHYVPRFYLKKFSSDEKCINLYNFKLAKAINSANLKHQCYRDYMYGKDGEHEHHLSQLEGTFAELLRYILATNSLPSPLSPNHESLCIFVLLQYARTAYSADAFDEMADGMWKEVLSKDPTFKKEHLDMVRIVHTDPANFAVRMNLKLYHLILDLDYKLLIAAPHSEFVTSDNPVVMYNQLLEFERFGSSTGLASKGLQIFFPLSPQHLLYFYDPAVYVCAPKRESVCKIPTKTDMLQLNGLQVAASLENIYYAGPDANVFLSVETAFRFRRKTKARIIKGPEQKTKKGSSQLLGMSREDVRTNLSLSFMRILKPAKKWRVARKLPGPKQVSVVRNPSLITQHEKFSELVEQGHYQPTEFLRYLGEKQ